jgi:REP element-mobilizing transposase RayT
MPYRKENFSSGAYYHLFNRGVNKELIFFERENYLFFLRQMRKYFTNELFIIIAYCLMPNHYHLLVYLKTDELGAVVQRFILSYSKAINKRFNRIGSLFQGPFKAVHVDNNEYLLHLSRYIHFNPVDAGLVRQSEAWEFSSYRDYIGYRKGTLTDPEIVLSQFASPQDYQKFVQDYQEENIEFIRHLIIE